MTEMRTCKICRCEKPYDPSQKQDSKASGFHGAKCWDCRLVASKLLHQQRRSTAEGLAKSRAASVKRNTERLKIDTWFALRQLLSQETNRILTLITGGGRPKDATTQKLFGADVATVKSWFESMFRSGLDWHNYKTAWTCDHWYPVAMAQNDLELRSCFLLDNCNVLTLDEHALKTLEDQRLVKQYEASV